MPSWLLNDRNERASYAVRSYKARHKPVVDWHPYNKAISDGHVWSKKIINF